MKRLTCIIILALFLAACGKSGSGDASNTPPAVGKPVLNFPAQNAACTTGTPVTYNQTSVTLTWTAAANATIYELNITNLLNNVSSKQIASLTQATLTLSVNTPYSWYVVAKSTSTTTTAQSDTWKFYNAGSAATYYAPYPADGFSPYYGQAVTATAGKINLTWVGADPDNDVANYSVYLGTSANAPPLLKAGVTDMFLNGITVSSGTTYYWYVLTTDKQGFTSTSSISNFTVN